MKVLFKRDKIFKQFIPVIRDFKEIPLPDAFPVVGGIARVYQTDWDAMDSLRTANELDLLILKRNDKAVSYAKVDRGYDVIMIYNKTDKSIMIAISRKRR